MIYSPTMRPDNVECCNCHNKGHYSAKYPHNALLVECQEVITVIAIGQSVVQGPEIFWPGKLEGIQVRDILLDTGCSRTLVHKDLLSKDSLLAGKAVAIRYTHGDTVLCPLAQVQLEVEGQAMEVTVAVADKLPMSVLLGTDIPLLSKLLSGSYK